MVRAIAAGGDPVQLALLIACGALWLAAAPFASAEPAPYEKCVEPSGEATGGTATLRIETVDRAGNATESRASLAWQSGDGASRMLLEMLAPDELRGSRVLLVTEAGEGPRAWAYLPEIAEVKRVGSRHLRRPLFGTSISYADLERARMLVEGAEVETWREEQLGGRPVWRLESRVDRERVTSWLDRERCVPLRTEVKDRKGRLARVVELSPEPFDPAVPSVPKGLVVRDLQDETETRVTVEGFARGEVALRFFDPDRLAPITTHAALPKR